MATKQIKTLYVPIETIHPNPWNPNRQDERTYEAERESIRAFGFIDPVTVREHPEIDGEWQVIDGEHRWRAAQDEELTTLPINSLGNLSDTDAQRLTIILNETRGEADVALLGKLLVQIRDSGDIDLSELTLGIPFSPADLAHLLEIGGSDFGDFQPGGADGGDGDDGSSGPEMVEVVLLYRPAQAKKFGTFSKMIGKEWGMEEDISGTVLEALKRQAAAR